MNSWFVGAAAAVGAGAAAAALDYRARVRGPFEATRYVWSRGLGLLCDHNGGVDFVKGQRGGKPAGAVFRGGTFDEACQRDCRLGRQRQRARIDQREHALAREHEAGAGETCEMGQRRDHGVVSVQPR